jgi:ribonuclease PH
MTIRKTEIQRNALLYPAGSVMISMGNTKVLCTASIEQGAPNHCKEKNTGWLTAEYSMLPGSTHSRNRREVNSGRVSGRTAEIQRLIGRSLRAVTDLSLFPDYTILIDCDVLQADGGTRTASITGAAVALHDAFQHMLSQGQISRNPMKEWLAAISVGIVNGKFALDLSYEQDSIAEVDFNVVMTENGKFIEVQGTAEHNLFSREQLDEMLVLAGSGIRELISIQKVTAKNSQ